MPARDLVAIVNAIAVPVEVVSILVALAVTGRTLADQGAEVIGIVLGGQVAVTAAFVAVRGRE